MASNSKQRIGKKNRKPERRKTSFTKEQAENADLYKPIYWKSNAYTNDW